MSLEEKQKWTIFRANFLLIKYHQIALCVKVERTHKREGSLGKGIGHQRNEHAGWKLCVRLEQEVSQAKMEENHETWGTWTFGPHIARSLDFDISTDVE